MSSLCYEHPRVDQPRCGTVVRREKQNLAAQVLASDKGVVTAVHQGRDSLPAPRA